MFGSGEQGHVFSWEILYQDSKWCVSFTSIANKIKKRDGNCRCHPTSRVVVGSEGSITEEGGETSKLRIDGG